MRPELSLSTLFSMPRLRRTWKELRKELARTGTRDCVDYLDIDTDSERWLSKIRQAVISGGYTPQHPAWFEAAKRIGAYRTLTRPALRDILVFRHICDAIYNVASAHEPIGAFFSRRHGTTKVVRRWTQPTMKAWNMLGSFRCGCATRPTANASGLLNLIASLSSAISRTTRFHSACSVDRTIGTLWNCTSDPWSPWTIS